MAKGIATKREKLTERAGVAHDMVNELMKYFTQRELAARLRVSQFWVWQHEHGCHGVPSDAIWSSLNTLYAETFGTKGLEFKHEETEEIGDNRKDAEANVGRAN
jgi:hypothetical protein